jgi:hypothetical protein
MYGALNVEKKLITQLGRKSRDESFEHMYGALNVEKKTNYTVR